jgi:hypothetical protein
MDHEKDIAARRDSAFEDHRRGSQFDPVNEGIVTEDVNKLKRNLHGRHMQMIAIGRSSLMAINSKYRVLTRLSRRSYWCRFVCRFR